MTEETPAARIMAARAAMASLPPAGLDLLFREARTFNGFDPRPVEPELLDAIIDLTRWGPTAMNGLPLRVSFLTSPEAKARLEPLLSSGNREKTMAAPVTAILWADLDFWRHLPRLAPHMTDPEAMFSGNPDLATRTARLSAGLQAGYFLLAARALGLDCGPMEGFRKAETSVEFSAGRNWEALLLVNLGYGDPARLRPRAARLDPAEIAEQL